MSCFDLVPSKKDACLKLGAKEFIDVKSKEFQKIENRFDFILSTIPYHYDLNDYHKMLKFGGEGPCRFVRV